MKITAALALCLSAVCFPILGREAKLVHTARDVYPRFSPDGRWIAFSSDRSGNLDVSIRSIRSHGAVADDRPPKVSSTTFRAPPPEFTFCALDGYAKRTFRGLRGKMPARPALTPPMRFFFISSRRHSTTETAGRRQPSLLLQDYSQYRLECA